MSSGPVARWLETFVCNSSCQQYVEVFQENGYNNLNEICNLNAQELLKMGIPIIDTEKIIDNVFVLKQTMQANTIVSAQNYPSSRDNQLDSMSCNYDSSITNSTPINNTKQRGKKQNKNSTNLTADSRQQQKQLVPNVTINQVVPNNNNSQQSLVLINSNNTNTNTTKKTKTKNTKNTNKNQTDSSDSIGLGIIGNDNNHNNNTNEINLNSNLSGQLVNSKLVNNSISSNNNSLNSNKLNTDVAKKIGNDILTMATMSQTNTKYTCVPISNSNSPINYTQQPQQPQQTNLNGYEFQNQYQFSQQQQSQYRNYQQSQSPTILLSPISNPSSTSSTHSSSNQLYNQHSPPNTIQQQQSSNESNYKYYQQQQYYDVNSYNNNGTEFYSNSMHQQQQNNNYTSYNSYTSYTNQMKQPTYNQNTYLNQSNNMVNNNKNSPLEYLERLALLPECQVVDPKSIVNDTSNANTNSNEFNNENALVAAPTYNDLNTNEIKTNYKRNYNDMPDLITSPLQANTNKKLCNNNNNTYTKSNQFTTMPINQTKFFHSNQSFYDQTTNENNMNNNDTSSGSSINSTATTASSNDSNQINFNSNIIDACNFDFLDYLPELNSTTIDQTIKTATNVSYTSSNNIINNDNLILNNHSTTDTTTNSTTNLDDITYSDTIYNL